MTDEALARLTGADPVGESAVVVTRDGIIDRVGARAADLVGWDPADLVGSPLTVLIPRRFHHLHERGFDRWRTTGELRLAGETLRLPAQRADGSEVEMELLLGHGPDGTVVGELSHPSGRSVEPAFDPARELQQIVRADLPLAEMLERAVAVLGQRLDWDIATVWMHDDLVDCLRAVAVWEAEPGAQPNFTAGTMTITFARGEGYPGAVWESASPIWSDELAADPRFARRSPAGADELRGGLFFPLLHEGNVVGVVELISRDARGLDIATQEALWLVADELGRLAGAQLAREAEAAERQRLRLALSAGRMGVWTYDLRSGRVHWTEELERIYGMEPGSFGGTLDAYLEAIHVDDRDEVVAHIQRAMASGERFEYRYRIRWPDGTIRWIDGAGQGLRQDETAVTWMTGVCFDVTEHVLNTSQLEEQASHASLAAVVGRTFSSAEPLPVKLDTCVNAVVEHLDAAFARIWTVDASGEYLQLQASAGMYTHLDGGHARVRIGELKIGLIAAEKAPHLTNQVIGDPRVSDQAWAEREGMVSFAGYPLILGGACIGVLALFSRHQLPESTLRALESIADTIAIGIEQARATDEVHRLLRQERTARQALDRQMQLIETIYEVGQAVVARLALTEVVQTVTDAVTSLTGASVGAFFYELAEDSPGRFQRYTVAGQTGQPSEGLPPPRLMEMLAEMTSGTEILRRADVTSDQGYVENTARFGLSAEERPVRSYLTVPVVGRADETLGRLHLGHPDPGIFSAYDERLAIGVAAQAAIAIENARLYEAVQHEAHARQRALDERARVAEVLQASLLPPSLPDIAGIDLGARYRSGVEEVGGDFYDVFPLRGASWGVVIGDVCGKGPEAARLTALARHSLRTATMLRDDVAAAMGTLNEALLQADSDNRFCTAVYARLTPAPAGAEISLVVAGHPPPVVARCDGPVEEVEGHGPLLGIKPDVRFPVRTLTLAPGDALVLYTDGLIEARRDGEMFGIERLRALAAEHCQDSADTIAGALLSSVTDFDQSLSVDDMAVLVVRCTT